jgi:ribosome-binding protein aMBF1 (putative translation factor)
MVSSEQTRAARAWLGWGQDELARRAKVGLSTVRDFERGARAPIVSTREAMQHALEAAGIRFLFEGERGSGIEGPDPTPATPAQVVPGPC